MLFNSNGIAEIKIGKQSPISEPGFFDFSFFKDTKVIKLRV